MRAFMKQLGVREGAAVGVACVSRHFYVLSWRLRVGEITHVHETNMGLICFAKGGGGRRRQHQCSSDSARRRGAATGGSRGRSKAG